MARKKRPKTEAATRVPKVRIARPKGRPFQLRYFCPTEGREVRISIGSRDEQEAERQKQKLKARLLLGIDAKTRQRQPHGPNMAWEDFREQYSELQLSTIGAKSAKDAESRLDIAERIVKPRILSDLSSTDTLHRLQSQLLAGAHSRGDRPRSPHTVKGYMKSILASLNWAHLQGWLEAPPRIRTIKTSKLKQMKGRPIVGEEFERMLSETVLVTGEQAAASWRYVQRGLWQSALRIDELMHVSWDVPGTIQPEWKRGRLPVLRIPHDMQKNATEEAIPLLPWFESLLLETPEEDRKGWVFNPLSLQLRLGRRVRQSRLNAEWVGKVISRIGKAAGVIVDPGNEQTGKPPKYASSHDLRRSCAERLLDAGVPPMTIARVLRHESWETTRRHYAPGDVQKDAGLLRDLLSTPHDSATRLSRLQSGE